MGTIHGSSPVTTRDLRIERKSEFENSRSKREFSPGKEKNRPGKRAGQSLVLEIRNGADSNGHKTTRISNRKNQLFFDGAAAANGSTASETGAAVVFAAAKAADVNDHRHKQDDQVDAGHRLMVIRQPGVDQCRERQKNEPDQRYEQILIGALQVVRSKEDDCERDSRKRHQKNYDQTGHERSSVERAQSNMGLSRRGIRSSHHILSVDKRSSCERARERSQPFLRGCFFRYTHAHGK
jgi:hypothetical protein